MGTVSKRLHRRLSKKTPGPSWKSPQRRPGDPLPGGVQDLQSLIDDGHDPIHAAYLYIQQLSSHFAENISSFPEMEAFAEAVGAAKEEYMPVGPPMSPLTRSFFWTWALYVLRISRSRDTPLKKLKDMVK